MRILILNNDYPGFLRKFYAAAPGLEATSYARQMAARNDTLFGVADFYSRSFQELGHDAAEIHVNNDLLQGAWMRENGHHARATPALTSKPDRRMVRLIKGMMRRLRGSPMTPDQAHVLRIQIEAFGPDLILNQEMAYVGSSFLRKVRAPGRKIIGQIASALPENGDFSAYDLVISSLPNLVQDFQGRGVPAALNRLAFDSSVLGAIGPQPVRDVDVSFVGSLSPDHGGRIALLEHLATRVPLRIWGNGIERLPPTSPLHTVYQGEAWGREMYDVLRRSHITLNHHIDLAEGWANNMRLYEATGAGAMLLTDAKRNLAEMFEPGRELAIYEEPADCLSKIQYYLVHGEERAAIAAAGKARTLRDHSYRIRAEEIVALARGLGGNVRGAAA